MFDRYHDCANHGADSIGAVVEALKEALPEGSDYGEHDRGRALQAVTECLRMAQADYDDSPYTYGERFDLFCPYWVEHSYESHNGHAVRVFLHGMSGGIIHVGARLQS